MRRRASKKALLSTLCAAAIALSVGPAPAGAAVDPTYFLSPAPPAKPPVVPPPTGYLNGPCGVAVDSGGLLYVSDYYHHAIDIFDFDNSPYVTQVANVDPLGGPCGIALDSSDRLFVNNYHRNITRYGSSPAFGTGTVFPLPSEDPTHHLPTGVSVNTDTDTVFVDNRTYISVFDISGIPVLDGGEPLKIGVGTLGDGYGIAVSQFPSTAGRLYVPDASSNTVKVYNPLVSKSTPVAEIKDPFGKPFTSLRDSAVAVDRVTGDVYFADNTQPKSAERPQATIYIFGSTGTYKGHLKYNVFFGQPVGIAVDNSEGANQGRIYVTTGNSDRGAVYGYMPPAGVFGPPLPPGTSLSLSTVGSGSGAVLSNSGIDCSSSCTEQLFASEQVTLTAVPDSGSEFVGWSGGECGGTGSCALEMTQAVSVSAEFQTRSGASGGGVSGEVPRLKTQEPALGPRADHQRAKKCKKQQRRKAGRCGKAKRHRTGRRR